MTYERVVAAAVAETTSKFKLAEALALDIPPQRRGPAAENSKTVPQYLSEARDAIIAAGGEPRSVETLAGYRKTALWVLAPRGQNFQWFVASFTAHRRAMEAGLSYEEFEALPEKTGDAVNVAAGRAPIRGLSSMGSWTPAQRSEAARELLSDPDVADEVIRDPEAKQHVVGAQIRAGQERIRESAEQRERELPSELREANRKLGQRDAQLALGQICDRFAREVSETLPGAGPLAASEKFWLSEARDRAAFALEALGEYLKTGSTGLSDEDLIRLAGGEA